MTQPQYVAVKFKLPQEDCPLHVLPTELLETIIEFLDPLSIVRLSCTCALFYNLVNQVAKWKFWTMKIIKTSCLHLSCTGVHFGVPTWEPEKQLLKYSELSSIEDDTWKQMFYSMQFWHMIRKWKYNLTFETSFENDSVTSMDIAGQDIVFGTSQGGLGFWNPDVYPALEALHQFQCKVLTVLVRLCSDKIDGVPTYQIIAKCLNRSTCIYDMAENTVHNLRSNYTGISFCQNTNAFYEWDPDRGLLTQMSIRGKTVQTQPLPKLPFSSVVAVNGDDGVERPPLNTRSKQTSTHIAISHCKGPVIITFHKSPSGQISQSCDEIMNDNNLCIYKAYIWPGQISFSITGGSLTILTVGHEVHKIRWTLCKCTSAYLFGNIFMVGTDTGTIFCYTFNTPSDLLNLDPLKYKTKLETGSSKSLIYVGIRVQNDLHPLPDIVAASRSKIYCFRAVY